MSGTSHTTMTSQKQRVPQEPVHGAVQTTSGQNGDFDINMGDCYCSKIQINGNVLYSAAPTTQINLFYVEGTTLTLLYGPLNIKTVDVSVGLTLHMKTFLGDDLHVRGSLGGIIRVTIGASNTVVRCDVWGYRQVTETI